MTNANLFQPLEWLVNTLLDDGFIQQTLNEFAHSAETTALQTWLDAHFQTQKLASINEAQLENTFILPLLQQLGWESVPQQIVTVQGKHAKPDWCLALNTEQKEAIMVANDYRAITAICEAKAWTKSLDTGKAKRDENPHHQLQDYLTTLRIRFGFLTNGRLWRFYDTNRITAQKTYLEFDLEKLLSLENSADKNAALALFSHFFARSNYEAAPNQNNLIEQTIVKSSAFTHAVEENLKAIIYGTNGEDSLFELIGKSIYQANISKQPRLEDIYEHSVILLFRLLFIVYFEDKNRTLLNTHPCYSQHSLNSIYQQLRNGGEKRAALHDGFYALKRLFSILNEGDEDLNIPLFNGGLFDPTRAPLLCTPKVFTNAELTTVFEKLLFKTERGNTLFEIRRDFKNMSVTHLGRIYEGLLEFRFERTQETEIYLEYLIAGSKKPIESYFDVYDAAHIKKQKGFKALREINIAAGTLRLKSASNSRKSSASYYTPQSLSERLVKAGIDNALAKGRPLIELRILDNACGSGHFLVESLNYLTDLALAALETDVHLQTLVLEEREKINEQFNTLNLTYEPEDAHILKRALLKRCIFGVDLNPFAVELARLSLWMDSFIFGTPLSFIEHHIQQGNALIGASIVDFIKHNTPKEVQNDLFVDDLRSRFNELAQVMQELDNLRDTTKEEVAQSKQLWKTRITPRLTLLSRALSFISTRRLLIAEEKNDVVTMLDTTPDLVTLLFEESTQTEHHVLQLIDNYAKRYHVFHYEVAFPEVFAGGNKGFDVIVGNPPWDKTKFSEADFFPQYHSNYRTLKNAEKEAVRNRLEERASIKEAYETLKKSADITNNYYKAHFPKNRGAGDGNLFRLFVERNLDYVLAPDGSLNYCLPSALMFEEGSLALRQHIFETCQMQFFYSFENRESIFPDIDSRYKFALMQIIKQAPDENLVIDSAFYLSNPNDLKDPARHIPYSLTALKTLSPHQLAMMELRDATDLTTLAKCYAAFKPLTETWLDFRAELHMTADRDLFIEKPAAGLLPLYQGKMIWQFNNLYEYPQYWLNPTEFDTTMYSKELYRMAQNLSIHSTITKKEAEKHAYAIRYDRDFIRLGFRDIARNTDERTLIFALLPKNVGAGNKVPVSIPKTYYFTSQNKVDIKEVSPLRLLFALAWFNSVPVDWLARFMIQITVNLTYLYRLPMPQPTDAEIIDNPDYRTLAKNALLLTLAADWDSFAELAPLFDITKSQLPTTPKAHDKLRAQNDKIVAQLYGITPTEMAHLLKSFKVMANKKPEYLTLLEC